MYLPQLVGSAILSNCECATVRGTPSIERETDASPTKEYSDEGRKMLIQVWNSARDRKLNSLLIVSLIVLQISLSTAGLSNVRRDEDLVDYDDDYELISDSEPKVNSFREDESPLSKDNVPEEMSTSQCFTRDSSRICDCGFLSQDFTVPIYSGNMLQLTIRNCKRIIIRENTFANIYNIAHLELENIEDLVLHSNAFSFPISDWGHVNILMRNVRVDFIPAHSFNGFIRGITIQNSIIGTFERFAVNGVRSNVHRFRILDTFIGKTEPYAFKKFTVETLEWNNVTMGGVIASKTFYGVDVTQSFSIANCNFTVVQPSAFDMTNVDSFALSDNTIQTLNGEAFRMALLNGATVQRNHIGECHPAAFRAMTINDNYWRHHNTPMPFRLSTNSLATMETIAPLVISEKFDSNIHQLKYLNLLQCSDLYRLQDIEFFNAHRDSILFRMTDKVLDSVTEGDEMFNSLAHFGSHYCLTKSWFWYYIIFGGLLLLILLIFILVILCIRHRRQKTRALILPDGRTYRETTIVMQIENHNLLKTDL